MIDTLNNSFVRGHYAEVFRIKIRFYHQKAVAITVKDQDSIYIHADTLRITSKPERRILRVYDARIYKSDMSGKVDSIYGGKYRYYQNDTPSHFVHDKSQMVGDTIHYSIPKPNKWIVLSILQCF